MKASICCSLIISYAILSCTQQEAKNDTKLVFKKLPDTTEIIIGATINGKKQGLWITYNDSGRISSCDTYINDSLTGESIGYFEDGTVLSRGVLKDGQREGEWSLYYGKNRTAEKGRYFRGKKIGIWEYYTEDGKLDRKVEYDEVVNRKILEDNHLTPRVPTR